MMCDTCGRKSRVIDTATIGSTVWRRRKCPHCGARWYTVETHDDPIAGSGIFSNWEYKHKLSTVDASDPL